MYEIEKLKIIKHTRINRIIIIIFKKVKNKKHLLDKNAFYFFPPPLFHGSYNIILSILLYTYARVFFSRHPTIWYDNIFMLQAQATSLIATPVITIPIQITSKGAVSIVNIGANGALTTRSRPPYHTQFFRNVTVESIYNFISFRQ